VGPRYPPGDRRGGVGRRRRREHTELPVVVPSGDVRITWTSRAARSRTGGGLVMRAGCSPSFAVVDEIGLIGVEPGGVRGHFGGREVRVIAERVDRERHADEDGAACDAGGQHVACGAATGRVGCGGCGGHEFQLLHVVVSIPRHSATEGLRTVG